MAYEELIAKNIFLMIFFCIAWFYYKTAISNQRRTNSDNSQNLIDVHTGIS
jgi:hypothetical protein